MIRPVLLALAALASVSVATGLSGGEDQGAASEHKPILVGTHVPHEMVEKIDRPGLYGVGNPSGNWDYAVVGSQLVRIERETNMLLAIIRPVLSAQ